MSFVINRSTVICLRGFRHSAVRFAAEAFCEDVARVLGGPSRIVEDIAAASASTIVIDTQEPHGLNWNHRETYRRSVIEDGRILHIAASDPLGAVFSLFDISREFLGIDPMQFWTDHEPPRRRQVEVPAEAYQPPAPAVRLRGWFVNGEDCLVGWSDEYPIPNRIWQKIYETILRCRGNLVIPGTDLPRSSPHRQLAADMGLWMTHHHAEPLGAEMFARAFPQLPPRYDLHREQFHSLYRAAIEEQKDWKIVWALGFRGQGDRPFWEDDPRYTSPRDRGQLLTKIIAEQRELVLEYAGRDNAAMCINLYGEAVELYRSGHFRLPDDVIRIWGDNGYGAMVSRRMWTDNPRHSTMPQNDASAARHGVYYHINFHDLQASNQLTMLVDPQLIAQELGGAISAGARDLVITNCGNIRPHVLDLDYVICLLLCGPKHSDAQVDSFYSAFCRRHFGDQADAASKNYSQYFQSLWHTSHHEDEKAGEEIYCYTAKHLVQHCLRHETREPSAALAWATGTVQSFAEQIQWFESRTDGAQTRFDELFAAVQQTLTAMPKGPGRQFFQDNLVTQVVLHRSGNAALNALCQGVRSHFQSNSIEAFLHLSKSLAHYQSALDALRACEHDRWRHFYRGDWLVGIAETMRQVRLLRSFVRGLDDDLFQNWMKRLIPEQERRVALAVVWRRPKDDDEMAHWLEHPQTVTLPALHHGPEGDRR